jgi:hypothetical protein
VSTPGQLRDFVQLNPEYARQADQQGLWQFRPTPRSRELDTDAAFALVDENYGTPDERAAEIARRAALAQERGEAREAQLEGRFAALNPEFGVLPSRTNPQQHQFAQGRERALALGSRVYLAETRENTDSAELAAWQIRVRALRAQRAQRAGRQAREQQQRRQHRQRQQSRQSRAERTGAER